MNLGTSIIIGIVAAGSVGYSVWRTFFRKCSKCGGRLRLDSQKDSMGMNISKRVTISFWRGPRKMTYVWKCTRCGEEVIERNWEME